jgi:hypothetical protein
VSDLKHADIASIRVFGHARAMLYEDRDFHGTHDGLHGQYVRPEARSHIRIKRVARPHWIAARDFGTPRSIPAASRFPTLVTAALSRIPSRSMMASAFTNGLISRVVSSAGFPEPRFQI